MSDFRSTYKSVLYSSFYIPSPGIVVDITNVRCRTLFESVHSQSKIRYEHHGTVQEIEDERPSTQKYQGEILLYTTAIAMMDLLQVTGGATSTGSDVFLSELVFVYQDPEIKLAKYLSICTTV